MNSFRSFNDLDVQYLQKSIDISRLAPPAMTAFSVGCVIVSPGGLVLSTGYSRELGDSSHAEGVALQKLSNQSADLAGCTLYSSLEPCSVRKSGNKSCCSLILENGITRVVFAMREPLLFVNCTGLETLQAAGLEVIEISSLANQVRLTNSHLLEDK
jgi:diaminohydroxyphosphoribosylaminopyrimidine deaminase/5-amino-6-(5-phosphoribosylamino)uracil reductase